LWRYGLGRSPGGAGRGGNSGATTLRWAVGVATYTNASRKWSILTAKKKKEEEAREDSPAQLSAMGGKWRRLELLPIDRKQRKKEGDDFV
jgi:hypothetical protein